MLDGGAALSRDDVTDVRTHGRALGEIGPHEDDPVVRPGGAEPHRDVAAKDETDAPDLRLPGDRALKAPCGEHALPASVIPAGVWMEMRRGSPSTLAAPRRLVR